MTTVTLQIRILQINVMRFLCSTLRLRIILMLTVQFVACPLDFGLPVNICDTLFMPCLTPPLIWAMLICLLSSRLHITARTQTHSMLQTNYRHIPYYRLNTGPFRITDTTQTFHITDAKHNSFDAHSN